MKRILLISASLALVAVTAFAWWRSREPVFVGPGGESSINGPVAIGATAGPAKVQASKGKTGAPSSGGAPAPEFTMKDIDGKTVSLEDFRGKKVVIIDFWATWCGPCRGTMPLLEKYWQKHKGEAVVVLSINEQESVDKVKGFIDRAGYTFRVLMDSDGSVQAAYRVYGLPTMYVIDKQGYLKMKHVGFRPDLETYLETVVTPLL